jgi:hypothetical protein
MLPLSSSAGSLGSLPLVITCDEKCNNSVDPLLLSQYWIYDAATEDNGKLWLLPSTIPVLPLAVTNMAWRFEASVTTSNAPSGAVMC